jgi:hypothetical protein
MTANGTTTTLSGNVVTSGNLVLTGFRETVILPTTGNTLSPDVSLGSIIRFTAAINFTFNGFTNPILGQSATVIITNAGGAMTSNMKFAGGSKTLSGGSAIDIISVFYDGTTYYASLTKGFV